MADSANAYTSTDAATFSRLGASMTALPPDEEYTQGQALTPVTTLKCERWSGVVRNNGDSADRGVYSAEHAAEFMRRGACMVVWPGLEGNEEQQDVGVGKPV